MSQHEGGSLDVESGTRLLRHLGQDEALEAGILTPMAGTRPIRLFSLEEAARFLVVPDPSGLAYGGTGVSVNYVEPGRVATWIDEILGDQDLADGLREIISSQEAYGLLVPKMRNLIESRIDQAKRAANPLAAGLQEPALR